ncbi:hypothetical protein XELAEV_18041547mg [Xenopus laevis]|uniref:Uncharacterized protein n=1 Tax=Xenopus laevis TaxID=8355 RepID=A0A974C2C6_XENLA|nr:hypothetical protein XELAEV_18041547mg [Xenopus laevis]
MERRAARRGGRKGAHRRVAQRGGKKGAERKQHEGEGGKTGREEWHEGEIIAAQREGTQAQHGEKVGDKGKSTAWREGGGTSTARREGGGQAQHGGKVGDKHNTEGRWGTSTAQRERGGRAILAPPPPEAAAVAAAPLPQKFALKVPGAAFLLPLVPSGALPSEATASTRLIGEAPLGGGQARREGGGQAQRGGKVGYKHSTEGRWETSTAWREGGGQGDKHSTEGNWETRGQAQHGGKVGDKGTRTSCREGGDKHSMEEGRERPNGRTILTRTSIGERRATFANLRRTRTADVRANKFAAEQSATSLMATRLIMRRANFRGKASSLDTQRQPRRITLCPR